ncbi:MAG TPA: DUF1549 and DUF1553 domain-containing protein [Verrucomicrobiota bacterium]|nr:hypothetical protein [Verrucomicrobiales bacterium]HRI15957.1 DUF1549 and DUF1553 domain-containing protein [Verrucomicrobiota bacterium]
MIFPVRLCLILALLAGAWCRASEPSAAAEHWAFRSPQAQMVPTVKQSSWVRSPVDAFVLAKLERERVAPSAEADRPTLLRRLCLDLIGVPPTPEEVDAFMADSTPDAYAKHVEQLLASPHFGERWGRHWLDLARYADTSGYQIDRERPWAWVYRDWVIRSFNRDQPFDQFTVEQLAGDLLPNATSDQRVASGFHRLTLSNHEDGVDAAEFAVKAKVDRVATTGLVWLGLTLGCAECHSHKYDPVSQREFYQMYAFFDGAEECEVDVEPGVKAYSFRERPKAPQTFVHVRGDFLRTGEEVRPAFLSAVSHDALKLTEANEAQSLQSNSASDQRPTRLDLAQWLVSAENPLTARVAVNQLWLHLFGRGLVATTEDFGVRGEPPSHPKLLDWLAREFVASGWSRKHVLRLILNSSTYRQASFARPELAERDPQNRWLARQNRIRLEAEILRDSALEVSGTLESSVGGRSFRPPMPADVKWLGTAGAWSWTDDSGPVLQRRSLYIFSQRTVAHPLLPTFDQANPNEACTRRDRSNNALQALTLLNNATFADAAWALADRVVRECRSDTSEQIQWAFRLCFGRVPLAAEQTRLEKLFANVHTRSPSEALFVVAQTLLNLDEFQNRE